MEQKRKGARSFQDLPKEILEQLNRGEIESVNLTEWLAVDARLLLKNLLVQTNREIYLNPILSNIEQLKKQTVNTINEAIGIGLLDEANKNKDSQFLESISTHASDAVRCWTTYTIGRNPDLSISEKLEKIKLFAADKHFGVREISWMAVRPHLTKEIEKSIEILTSWTTSPDDNVRRFASESTRPRGVWSEHIEALKLDPEMALNILEALKSDSAKYVQDSVGNWLNDASKTQPQFVMNLCLRWEKESPTKETIYIIKKALRTIQKTKE